jgi:hypothetical protein
MTAGVPAEAVEAAARALHLNDCRSTGHDEGDCWDETEKWERAVYLSNATAALTAAVPLLREAWETELREQIAVEIEETPITFDGYAADVQYITLTETAHAVRGVRNV